MEKAHDLQRLRDALLARNSDLAVQIKSLCDGLAEAYLLNRHLQATPSRKYVMLLSKAFMLGLDQLSLIGVVDAFMLRDPSWVKSRIAARILLRRHSGRLLSRDYSLATRLAQDPGVTDRLIGQALASICAQKGFSVDQYHAILHATLASRT